MIGVDSTSGKIINGKEGKVRNYSNSTGMKDGC